eukprot:snap_masked-scaffold_29-processed-gene-0.35-mRNA-1 protein AED:1.00 eAED:1.00 QI:0/-1/0/0/-1/1/1/0/64
MHKTRKGNHLLLGLALRKHRGHVAIHYEIDPTRKARVISTRGFKKHHLPVEVKTALGGGKVDAN